MVIDRKQLKGNLNYHVVAWSATRQQKAVEIFRNTSKRCTISVHYAIFWKKIQFFVCFFYRLLWRSRNSWKSIFQGRCGREEGLSRKTFVWGASFYVFTAPENIKNFFFFSKIFHNIPALWNHQIRLHCYSTSMEHLVKFNRIQEWQRSTQMQSAYLIHCQRIETCSLR